MKKGKLITFYGINNIGKTTHARVLTENLCRHGIRAVYIKYPIYDLNPTGPLLNDILRGKKSRVSEEELQKLFMQNRKDFESKLKQILDEGLIVIAEDYSGTGIAWGTAKGLDATWCERLNAPLLNEDFAILLVGKRALHAKEAGHIHEEDDDLMEKVDLVLQEMAERKGWHIIEVQPEKKATVDLIWKKVSEFLEQ
jgi:thymidylate kinase